LSSLLAAVVSALFAVPALAQTASDAGTLAFCTQARADALRDVFAFNSFDENKKAMMRDALAKVSVAV